MEKVKNSAAGVVIGIILLIVGTILIWVNEGDVVKNNKTVSEIREKVIEVKSDEISASNDQKLIATNGKVSIEDQELYDSIFGVKQKSIKLRRIVEVYQYKEESETNSNDKNTYKYKKVWEEDLIDSTNFSQVGYSNPTYKPYDSTSFLADYVKVGQFYLSKEQIGNLPASTRLTLPNELYLPYGYKIDNNYITNSSDISNPQIGDVRVSYEYNDYKEASVLAVQNGNSFSDYISSSGKSTNEVLEGILNSNQIINKIVSDNETTKWLWRLAGCIVVILGYLLIFGLAKTITSFIPIIGSIIETGIVIVSMIIGFVHSLIIFTIAWIRFRPIVGIISLVVIILLIVLLKNKLSKAKNNKMSTINSAPSNQNDTISQVIPENNNTISENQNFIPLQTNTENTGINNENENKNN